MFIGKEYKILNKMLDDAIEGSFEEKYYDESELSKLQTKLMRYLCSSSMSEKKITEEKENLKELITNISHQIKTPLTNVLMYSELLKETAEGSKDGAYADEIYIHAKKLECLVQALVKMSRLETGVFQYERKITSYLSVIDKAVSQANSGAKEKNIRICVNRDEDHKALIDGKWVAEAVFNVIDNAVKYSESGSSVYIEAFSYEIFSGIRIRDEGKGIEEEEIPLLFGRFYRGMDVHDKDGIGVGLYLSREITEGNGGYIKVNSKRNKGTIFEICFPNVSAL